MNLREKVTQAEMPKLSEQIGSINKFIAKRSCLGNMSKNKLNTNLDIFEKNTKSYVNPTRTIQTIINQLKYMNIEDDSDGNLKNDIISLQKFNTMFEKKQINSESCPPNIQNLLFQSNNALQSYLSKKKSDSLQKEDNNSKIYHQVNDEVEIWKKKLGFDFLKELQGWDEDIDFFYKIVSNFDDIDQNDNALEFKKKLEKIKEDFAKSEKTKKKDLINKIECQKSKNDIIEKDLESLSKEFGLLQYIKSIESKNLSKNNNDPIYKKLIKKLVEKMQKKEKAHNKVGKINLNKLQDTHNVIDELIKNRADIVLTRINNDDVETYRQKGSKQQELIRKNINFAKNYNRHNFNQFNSKSNITPMRLKNVSYLSSNDGNDSKIVLDKSLGFNIIDQESSRRESPTKKSQSITSKFLHRKNVSPLPMQKTDVFNSNISGLRKQNIGHLKKPFQQTHRITPNSSRINYDNNEKPGIYLSQFEESKKPLMNPNNESCDQGSSLQNITKNSQKDYLKNARSSAFINRSIGKNKKLKVMLGAHGFTVAPQTQKSYQHLSNPNSKVGKYATEIFQVNNKNNDFAVNNYNAFSSDDELDNPIDQKAPINANESKRKASKNSNNQEANKNLKSRENFLESLSKRTINNRINSRKQISESKASKKDLRDDNTVESEFERSVDSKSTSIDNLNTSYIDKNNKRGGLFANIEDENNPIAKYQYNEIENIFKEEGAREKKLRELKEQINKKLSGYEDQEYDIKKEMKQCITQTFDELVKKPVNSSYNNVNTFLK